MTRDEAIKRIAEIDAKIEAATSWGSWMAGMASERKNLAALFSIPQHIDTQHTHSSDPPFAA